MALPPDERRDRAKVNEAVREGLRLGELLVFDVERTREGKTRAGNVRRTG
jgi:hypothetical protein